MNNLKRDVCQLMVSEDWVTGQLILQFVVYEAGHGGVGYGGTNLLAS